jgi:hypothetical protein
MRAKSSNVSVLAIAEPRLVDVTRVGEMTRVGETTRPAAAEAAEEDAAAVGDGAVEKVGNTASVRYLGVVVVVFATAMLRAAEGTNGAVIVSALFGRCGGGRFGIDSIVAAAAVVAAGVLIAAFASA